MHGYRWLRATDSRNVGKSMLGYALMHSDRADHAMLPWFLLHRGSIIARFARERDALRFIASTEVEFEQMLKRSIREN